MPRQLQIGLYADTSAKVEVAAYLREIGQPEGPGHIVALNRWAYDGQGSGAYVRPDVFIDFGPNWRHWIDGKSSFVNGGVLPSQLYDFSYFTAACTGTITTPTGSFRTNPPLTPRRGP